MIELSREKLFQGHIFDVSRIRFMLPNGKKRAYDLVEHVDSVTILPIDSEGIIYFVSQYRVGAGDMLLELPAGVLDPGETPLECARREVREEIGMAAGNMQELGSFYLSPGYTDEYMTIFLVSDLYEAPLSPDEDEFLHLERISKREVFQSAFSGRIRDGKTLAALLLAQPYLEADRADDYQPKN